MTKIAIISQAEQGVLIDISGCSSLAEAKQYLMSTLQVSSHFWEGLIVDLNLGPLVLTPEQVNEIQAIVSEVGVQPRQIFSLSPITRSSLIQCRLPLGPQQFPSSAPTKANENPFLKQESAGVQAENDLSALVQNAQEIESPVTAGGIATAIVELSNWSDDSSSEKPVPVAAEAVATATQERPASALPNLWLAARAGSTEAFAVAEPLAEPVHTAPLATTNNANTSSSKAATPAVLMMKQTLRSGQSVSHKGHLVIIGDVNPGAELVADGDITVWGALRGMAHAGANGNTNAEIRALKFEPIQLRIAQAIARSPDRSKAGGFTSTGPETARVVDGKIRISGSEPE